ncbi:MAG: ribosome silencing factor [Holosporales bacterium]|jgi:ribosome-associated protein|nr:ribosome silencing factor [Holosporales bacterium]
MKIQDLKTKILKFLDDKKANNIVEIDASSYNSKLSDLCIIASGTSSRHMQSVADNLYKFLKSECLSPKIEGSSSSGWVLIEAFGIETHLFKPEVRTYYDIESLWREVKIPQNNEK